MSELAQRGRNRAAVVTGASRGIGRAIVKRLAAEGYHVVANDIERQREEMETLRAEVEAGGGRCDIAYADVSNPADVASLAEYALARCGTSTFYFENHASWVWNRRPHVD